MEDSIGATTVNRRIEWIDALKGFAILFVVLGHALLGYVENNAFLFPMANIVLFLQEYIYTWHMPVFFVISGYTFSLAYVYLDNNIIKIKKKKVYRQAINLLLIFLLFQMLLCGLKIVFSAYVDNKLSINEAVLNVMLPNTLMWYLWVLIIYYVIACVVLNTKKLCKSIVFVIIVLFVVDVVERYLLPVSHLRLCISNLIHCAFFFFIGILLEKRNGCGCKESKFSFRGTIITFGIVEILFCLFWDKSKILQPLINEIHAAFVAFVLFELFSKRKIKNKFLVMCGKNSLIIYLLHTYIVTAIKVGFIRLGLCNNLSAVPIVFITTLLPVMLCLAIAVCINKSKIISCIFNPIQLVDKFRR